MSKFKQHFSLLNVFNHLKIWTLVIPAFTMLFLVCCCQYEGRQLKRAVYCSSRTFTILFWEYLKISVLLRDHISSYIADEVRAIRNEIFNVFFQTVLL